MTRRTRGAAVLAALVALLACAVALAGSATAATITATTKLTASDASANARFGTSLAQSSDGNTLLVGNQFRASGVSAAYVLTKSAGTWTEQAQLVAPNGAADGTFGRSVTLSAGGTLAVVGAPNAAVDGVSSAGAVYVFAKDLAGTWQNVARLTAPTPASSSSYGQSVSVSADGNELVVGASSTGSDYRGAAYFYSRSVSTGEWSRTGSIGGGSEFALLGNEVEMSGNGMVAAVGQPLYRTLVNGNPVYQPNVLTFVKSGGSWIYTRTISSPVATNNGFGDGALSLTHTGNQLLVGAEGTYVHGGNVVGGAAHLYTAGANNTWSAPGTFTMTANTNREFGAAGALASDGSSILISAPRGNAYSSTSDGNGTVYRWAKTSTGAWGAADVYTTPLAANNDCFGCSLATGNDTSHPTIGALANASSAGAVFAF